MQETLPLSGRTKGLLNRAERAGPEAPPTAQLLLLLFRKDPDAARTLTEFGIREAHLLQGIRDAREESSGALDRALERARRLARRNGARQVEPHHLLQALAEDPGSAAARILKALKKDVPRRTDSTSSPPRPAMPPPSPLRRTRPPPRPARTSTPRVSAVRRPTPPRARASASSAKPATVEATHPDPPALDPRRTPVLAQCCEDALHSHHARRVGPVIGRDALLDEILEVLERRDAPHALLVGPSGAGKSAMLDALVARWSEHPPAIETRLLRLRPEALLAGSGVRGALAARFESLSMEAASLAPRVVLFLDDLHLLLGGDGPEEFAALLRARLADGTFRMMATLSEEAHGRLRTRETDLLRRFTPIVVEPTSPERTEDVLTSLAPRYAVHHGVQFHPEAVREAVRLSERFLNEPAQPARALTVLDRAAARAARLGASEVGRAVVAHVVARLARLPTERLLRSDAERLLGLRRKLAERIVGHEAALDRIAATLRRAAAGFRGERPLASFLLLGPTGVGKTEAARAIADVLFDGAMVRLDMAEFAEAHAVARLLGAPPGYVGHDEGGQLTEAVRRRPYQLVLLDEIEKAHPQVWLALLSMLDEGRLTDGRGRTVDFRHTVVVMTSNLGAEPTSSASRRPVGFGATGSGAASSRSDASSMKEARAQLPPELWNRIDAPLWFGSLRREEVLDIAAMRLRRLADRLHEVHGVSLRWTPEALRALLDAGGWDPQLGARPMRRAIERYVEEPLADALLEGRLNGAREAVLSVGPEGLRLETRMGGADAAE